jgi:hypothetical protein
MTASTALLAALAALAAEPEFTDPAFKGMPFPFDRAAIPSEYHGTWAIRRADCQRRGNTLRITRTLVNDRRIAEVNGYSDHPAIFVRLRHGRNSGLGIGLDISLDRHWLRRSDGFGSEPVLLQRCQD